MPSTRHQNCLGKSLASNCWEKVHKLPYLHMLIQQKSPITSQKIGYWDFWQIANSILNKGKSAIPLFSGLEVLSSASDKAKLFAKNFLKNLNVDNSVISLPVCPFRTNLKLHIIL